MSGIFSTGIKRPYQKLHNYLYIVTEQNKYVRFGIGECLEIISHACKFCKINSLANNGKIHAHKKTSYTIYIGLFSYV